MLPFSRTRHQRSLPCFKIRVWSTLHQLSSRGAGPAGCHCPERTRTPRGHWERHQARWLDTLSEAKEAEPAVHNSVNAESLQEPEIKSNALLTVLFCEESPRRGQERHGKKKKKKEISCLERFPFFQFLRPHPLPPSQPRSGQASDTHPVLPEKTRGLRGTALASV